MLWVDGWPRNVAGRRPDTGERTAVGAHGEELSVATGALHGVRRRRGAPAISAPVRGKAFPANSGSQVGRHDCTGVWVSPVWS